MTFTIADLFVIISLAFLSGFLTGGFVRGVIHDQAKEKGGKP